MRRYPGLRAGAFAAFVLLAISVAGLSVLTVALKLARDSADAESVRANGESAKATRAEKEAKEQSLLRSVDNVRRLASGGAWQEVLAALDGDALSDFDDPVQKQLWRIEAENALNRPDRAIALVRALPEKPLLHQAEVLLWKGDALRFSRRERVRCTCPVRHRYKGTIAR